MQQFEWPDVYRFEGPQAGRNRMIRRWWKRHFHVLVGADVVSEPADFERCSCCGQTYNTRDLQQVLPHFEHQLGLGAEPVTGSLSNESLPSFGNVVPLRRAASRSPGRRIDTPSHGRGRVH
jgi:hypothetical protein